MSEPSLLTSRDDVAEYIKRKLGWPTVAVELTDQQVDDCIQDAMRMFDRYLIVTKANVQYGVQSTIGTSNNSVATVIQLPETTLGVLYVCFLLPDRLLNYTQTNIFEILSRVIYPQMPLGEWVMIRSFFNLFQKVRGSEPIWRYDPTDRKLYLDAASGPYDVFYITTEPVTVEAICTGSKRRYESIFLKAAVGYAKQILGYVRGKFPSIPAPGGTLTTDHDRLAREGNDDIADIDTKLKNMTAARALPIVG